MSLNLLIGAYGGLWALAGYHRALRGHWDIASDYFAMAVFGFVAAGFLTWVTFWMDNK
jgi:hypothetical protein